MTVERFAKNFFAAGAVILWLIVAAAVLDMKHGYNALARSGRNRRW